MDGYGPASYGDGFADVYDAWYADVSPPAQTAAFLVRRTAGPVVELGSGTGRLAGPIRSAGLAVVGLDSSEAMIRRSVARHPDVPVVVADMSEQPFRAGGAGAVLLAFNTLFNLPAASLQRHALTQAAALVAPGDIVVVEAFVPGDAPGPAHGVSDRLSDGRAEPVDEVAVVRLEADVVVLRVSRTDRAAGTVSGHHVELRDGAPVRLRPWHLAFTDPDGLDRLAAAAGLALVERVADWGETPFDAFSPTHVSVYRPTEAGR